MSTVPGVAPSPAMVLQVDILEIYTGSHLVFKRVPM